MNSFMQYSKDVINIKNDTLVLILAGGKGTRLHEFTVYRSKPAVHFGGIYRIIDFTLSNCINSHFDNIGIITQYMSYSLHRHLSIPWNLDHNRQAVPHFNILQAAQRYNDGNNSWYNGTADAVRKNLDTIKETYNPKYIIILSGDHIYQMDYNALLDDHIQNQDKKRCTVAYVEIPKEEAKEFGVLDLDQKTNQVTKFVEKPQNESLIPLVDENTTLASMGIYVFDADYLTELLELEQDGNKMMDFGKDVLPHAMAENHLYGHNYSKSSLANTYWRDVGTLDSYYEASMDYLHGRILDDSWPMHTSLSAKKFNMIDFDSCIVKKSIISQGSKLENAKIVNSIISEDVIVQDGSIITNSIILPDVTIGKNVELNGCIVTSGCVVPNNLKADTFINKTAQYFRHTDKNIIIITQDMLERYIADQRETNSYYLKEII